MSLGNLLRLVLALVAGLAGGLAFTWTVVDGGHGFGRLSVGAWQAWPRLGAADAEPYSRAALARSAEVPMTLAEGLMFLAETDEAGRRLDLACSYRLRGDVPAAAVWTLTAYRPDGGLVDNRVGRYGLTSAEALTGEPRRLDVMVSATAAPGNWLPVGGDGRFVLALRLYDTPLSSAPQALASAKLPAIERLECRP